jgi:putative peptidoglycan lipid II flippase
VSLVKKAGSMSGAVFLSRILGLMREQVFAYFFGAGLATDAYLVAFRIPNLLRDLFAEGALSSAFVTVFSREPDPERQRQMAARVLVALSLIVGLLCLGILVFSSQLVHWMAPDFALVPGKIELTTHLTRWFSPFLLFVAAAALSMGVLNTLGYFFVPSLGSAAFNLASILVGGGAAWLLRSQGLDAMIVGFTIGSLFGGFCQWCVQWPLLSKQGYGPFRAFKEVVASGQLKTSLKDPALRRIGWLMTPSILAVAAVQINVFVNTILASSLVEGSVSWMSYAYRLLHFPLGVFGVALSTAALPSLSKLMHDGKVAEFEETLCKALRLTWILGLGSAAGLIAFRLPLVSLLFEHGRFTHADTVQTALALTAFALSLPALNTTKIFVQVYHAIDMVWIPSVVSLVLVVSHYFFASWGASHYGHVGLALATAFTSLLNALVLSVILKIRGHKLADFESLKTLLGALSGVLMLLALDWLNFPEWIVSLRGESKMVFLGVTLVSIAFFGLLYLFLAAIASRESRQWFQRLTRRFSGRK